MTEREEPEIVDSLQKGQVSPVDPLADVSARAASYASVSGECSIKECVEDPARDTGGRQQADGKDEPMEIHAPMGKVESLKEFATHILIVTIGILIAFGLEGIRESWREHIEVGVVRDGCRAELLADQDNLSHDLMTERQVATQLDQVIVDLPQLTKKPAELEERVHGLTPSFYFFSTSEWESALSSGALTHMRREEVFRLMDAYQNLKIYQDNTNSMQPGWLDLMTYFQSHHSYTGAEMTEGEQKLRIFKMELLRMEHLGQQTSVHIADALKAR